MTAEETIQSLQASLRQSGGKDLPDAKGGDAEVLSTYRFC